MRGHLKIASLSISLAFLFCGLSAIAEEPGNQPAAAQTDSVRIDRDGKKICGYDLMNDSERGGYRNIMHQTKALADRDEIRADHCARMRARAKERGVSLDE
jgi:hypothetical protein